MSGSFTVFLDNFSNFLVHASKCFRNENKVWQSFKSDSSPKFKFWILQVLILQPFTFQFSSFVLCQSAFCISRTNTNTYMTWCSTGTWPTQNTALRTAHLAAVSPYRTIFSTRISSKMPPILIRPASRKVMAPWLGAIEVTLPRLHDWAVGHHLHCRKYVLSKLGWSSVN